MLEKVCYVLLTATAVAMASASLGLLGTDSPPTKARGPQPGDPAPALRIEAISGETSEVLDKNQNSLLIFFSTECVHCRRSLPTYRQIAAANCDLDISLIVLDREGEDLGGWWAEHGWETDEACADVQVGVPVGGAGPYGVVGTPTHVLVDGEENVTHRSVGAMSDVPEWLEPA